MKKETGPAAQQISTAVKAWLRDLGQVLKLVDDVLSQCHALEDVPSELREMIHNLRPLVRQCRAQTPTDEMMNAWLRAIAKPDRN